MTCASATLGARSLKPALLREIAAVMDTSVSRNNLHFTCICFDSTLVIECFRLGSSTRRLSM